MSSSPSARHGLVLRNTLLLVAAQAAGAPLSILVNAVMGRYLGPSVLGEAYLAWQLAQFGFLFVDWGHGNVITAAIAREHSRAGALLGTSMTWRVVGTFVAHGLLAVASILLGYKPSFQIVLALVVAQFLLSQLANACQDAIRGFERTDVTATAQIGQAVLAAAVVIPTVMLGGKLPAVLAAQLLGIFAVLVYAWRMLRSVGVKRLSYDSGTMRELFRQGVPFLIFGVSLVLQPNVDAVMLSKLAPEETIGWHAAARRLIGILVMPASALIMALYPTLCRLFSEDRAAYADTTRSAIKGTAVLAIPVALSCAFYRDIGIEIFSKRGFGPAAGNLLVLSAFLFLVYFSMPLGSALLAAGRQRAWAAAQSLCVIVSAVLDPLLIPWFQKRYHNGGLGVCVASVVSEVLMVSGGILLMPKGVFDRGVFVGLARAVAAGGAMALVANALSWLNPFLAAPVALTAYVVALWAVGGLGDDQIQIVRGAVMRRIAR